MRKSKRRSLAWWALPVSAVVFLAPVVPAGEVSAVVRSKFFEPLKPPRPVQVTAHGGARGTAPQSTPSSILICADDGIEWVAVTVRLTRDGAHVLAHDPKLENLSDGSGEVASRTLAEIEQLDAGSWFARRYEGVRLLTLRRALALSKGRINLRLECAQVDPESLVDEIKRAGMIRQVIVLGDADTTARVRAASAGQIAVMERCGSRADLESRPRRTPLDAVEIPARLATSDFCRACRERGTWVEADATGRDQDRPETWSRLVAAGVNCVLTDFPQEFIVWSIQSRGAARPVQISFHRAASRYAPENTMPTIERAIALGADYIELDIRRSRDGVCMLLHDARLNRTSNARGAISDQNADDLARVDAGSWFGQPFKGTRIPTFEQALTALSGRCGLYLDAKSIPPEQVAELLRRHNMTRRSVVFQSPSYLTRLRSIDPEVRRMPSLNDPRDLDKLADEIKPYAFDANWAILSKDLIDRCHARGILVFSDALGYYETVEAYMRAIDLGIDVIQTDHPLRVWRAIELRLSRPVAPEAR